MVVSSELPVNRLQPSAEERLELSALCVRVLCMRVCVTRTRQHEKTVAVRGEEVLPADNWSCDFLLQAQI